MRRRILESGNTGGVKPSQSKACDICFYDKTADSLVIADGDTWNVDAYPSSKYVPIGIVVVPGYHDVYGDGSCGVISLKNMSYTTPDEGDITRQKICYGQYLNDIPELINYDVVCHIGSNGNIQDTIQGTTINAMLPSDKFKYIQCPHDTDTYYDNDDVYYIPSPYLTDGSRNPLYYQISSPSSLNNAMSDFDGVSNSQILQNYSTGQSNWKTASTITLKVTNGYSPAACCCWRYHTEGTSQGDWYLPACGELGYIMPYFDKINRIIYNIQNKYSQSIGIDLGEFDYILSSTEQNSDTVYQIFMLNSYVSSVSKDNISVCVRAFLRVK